MNSLMIDDKKPTVGKKQNFINFTLDQKDLLEKILHEKILSQKME